MTGPYNFDFDGAGAYLGISGRTVRRRLSSIPHVRFDFGIRFSKQDLDEYAQQFHREPLRAAKVDLADILGPRKRRKVGNG